MTSLPSQHPTISLHLTDATLTPLITSSSSQSHLESLTSLTTSAIHSQNAMQRASLGRPQRIMVEYPDRGPVVLHSYLDPSDLPRQSKASPSPDEIQQSQGSSTEEELEEAAASGVAVSKDNETPRPEDTAPPLISIVVAGSADDAREARRAATRLERVGRDFQREWVAENIEEGHDTS